MPGKRMSLMTMPAKFSPMRLSASSALPTPTLVMSSQRQCLLATEQYMGVVFDDQDGKVLGLCIHVDSAR